MFGAHNVVGTGMIDAMTFLVCASAVATPVPSAPPRRARPPPIA